MQELIQHQGINLQQGFVAGDHAVIGHIDQQLEFHLGAGFQAPRVQQPEFFAFNDVNDFLNGFEMMFDFRQSRLKLLWVV